MKIINKTIRIIPNPSAFTEYQLLLTWLLNHCYGLELNDTPYHDEHTITQQIDNGVTVRETINELVDKFDLVRVDRPGFGLLAQDPMLNGVDLLRARSALGLRNPVNRGLV